MTFVPFPPWEPDRAEYAPDATDAMANILPVKDGWAPFPAFDAISSALPGPCKGAAWVRKTNGTTDVYAATADKLFKLDGTDLTWNDVSRTSPAYLGVPSGEYWSFQPFGDKLVACNANDEPQVINVDTGTEFEDLGGSPEKARYAAAVGYQLGLFGHLSDPSRLSLSGYGDPSFWTRFRNGSGRQVLEKGGWIQGVVGDQGGVFIAQQDRWARLSLLPATDVSFRIDEWERNRGVVAPGSIVSTGNMVFYKAEDDFYLLGQAPGEPSRSLGFPRVAKFILDHQNGDFVSYMQGAADPINKRVFWRWWNTDAFNEDQSSGIIGYDWGVDRWFSITDIALQYIFPTATQGTTLEGLDAFGTLETLAFSLDSRVWQGGRPVLGAFNHENKLGFFSGVNREAIVETGYASLGGEGRRAFVQGFRPLCDTDGITGRAIAKDTFGGAKRTGPSWPQDVTGMIPVGAVGPNAAGSGRQHRLQATIPAGAEWHHISGVEVKARPEGRR